MDIAYKTARTRTIDVAGTCIAYRQLGDPTGTPVIFLNHLAAVLDNWDPRVVDGIAAEHPVITFDYRGVGASEGAPRDTVDAMGGDVIAFIRALGFDQVDLLGFSLGGMVAQAVVQEAPQLVRRMILAGTGPAGGEGIDKVTGVTIADSLKATLTFKDPKELLFFTRTANGKSEARQFVKRLKERTEDRDKAISLRAFRAQLRAVRGWGTRASADLSGVQQPVLVVNGEADRMVPTSNSHDLARRLSDAELKIYPDAGHGGIFQYHQEFVEEALRFLEA